MDTVMQALDGRGVSFYLESYSALDRYLGVREPGPVYLRTDETLVTLAQLFDDLSFPGDVFVDAKVIEEGRVYLFRCVDRLDLSSGYSFTALDLLYDNHRDSFLDPAGIYYDLRQEQLVRSTAAAIGWDSVTEAARLVSRYHYVLEDLAADQEPGAGTTAPGIDEQRGLLSTVLTNPFPHKGLAVLEASGFVRRLWPELQEMRQIQQSKEHHPEGDVWDHTLQALQSRKGRGLRLSLATLLHDIGKPPSRAEGTREHPFNNHADMGAPLAARFLRRLGYDRPLIDEVDFLVRHHMMPAALGRLPLYRTERMMSSPVFPDLLELYRADLVSTYRQPSGYYEACRIYKRFMKKSSNPFIEQRRSRPPD